MEIFDSRKATKEHYQQLIDQTLEEVRKEKREPLKFGANGEVTMETVISFIREPKNLAVLKRLANK